MLASCLPTLLIPSSGRMCSSNCADTCYVMLQHLSILSVNSSAVNVIALPDVLDMIRISCISTGCFVTQVSQSKSYSDGLERKLRSNQQYLANLEVRLQHEMVKAAPLMASNLDALPTAQLQQLVHAQEEALKRARSMLVGYHASYMHCNPSICGGTAVSAVLEVFVCNFASCSNTSRQSQTWVLTLGTVSCPLSKQHLTG